MTAETVQPDPAAPALILHHYDFSNYSEKVRLVLGHKSLDWHSVTIPAYAPKPDYTPLTGGYRRTPALQIGADVYCDTRLIADTLEQLHPTPTLYPGATTATARARAEVLVHWAETALMRPVALYITAVHAHRFEAEFHADRALLHGHATPDVARVRASAPRFGTQVDALLPVLEALLPESGFVAGESPSLADFALYEAPWFLKKIGGNAALPEDLPRTRAWLARVAAIGHGNPRTISAADALRVARESLPATLPAGGEAGPEGMEPGTRVRVTPLDQRSPAYGTLLFADASRLVIGLADPLTGRMHVHFPRVGYRLDPA